SPEIAVVMGILLLTVFLFAFEVVGVDVAAVTVMVLLGLFSSFNDHLGLAQPLVPTAELFRGFSGNAVMSIVAVMIIGAGLDKTGLMGKVAGTILKVAGRTEARIIPAISGSVGFISSFMQNVGAAALFLPVVSRVSARTRLPMSRLLMPMGFCAILGGTITMVGSSPLILLNDLILTSNKGLPTEHQMETWSLFAVTPIGVALLASGIAYFVLAGRFVLPGNKHEDITQGGNTMQYFQDLYGLDYGLFEVVVPPGSPLVGRMLDDVERDGKVRVIAALRGSEDLRVGPGSLARDVWMRKTYGLAMVALHRSGKTLREGEGIRDLPLQAGDALVVHTPWEALARLEKDRNFVVITTEYPHEDLRPHKVIPALVFFGVALLLIGLDVQLSIALMTGAIGMILSGVLRIEEAYQAVSWKSVFLLASLIPLGLAVETTGAAGWIADQTLSLLGGVPTWVLQLAIAVLATCFTLVMSNVGATVLLVPLAVNIAIGAGANPAVFALTVALATSNSFFLPTHQVNALIMGPAGYRVADFMRAGGIMTVLFLTVMMLMLNLVY
ncbi:MAG TPA: SLC13 family permease, partial [Thiobacillaceae bacterium]